MQIPDHELLNPIASGAYGEVWLARNAAGTRRAVKIVRRDRHATAEPFEREFKRLQEFKPVSRAHKGLVDILTLGLLPEGAGCYYAMELADDAHADCGTRSAELNGGVSAHIPHSEIRTPHSYAPHTLGAELKSRGALPAEDVIALGLKRSAASRRHGVTAGCCIRISTQQAVMPQSRQCCFQNWTCRRRFSKGSAPWATWTRRRSNCGRFRRFWLGGM